MNIIKWDLYEITSPDSTKSVKLRGRLRKLAISKNLNLLVENSTDKEGVVVFALIENSNKLFLSEYLKTILNTFEIKLVLKSVENPVLSKMKVNISDRYEL
jgi:hypothetical protein